MLFLSDLAGQGELVDRVHDLDKSVNFLKMILFLSFIVFARLINPDIFSWLIKKGVNMGKARDFEKDNPEGYIFGVSMLLIFSVLSVGVFLSQMGAYQDFRNPVLINIAITIFFFTVFLVLVNFLQAVLFSVKSIFNSHFVDLLSFLVIIGAGAFVTLLGKWFLNEAQFLVVQSAVFILLAVIFSLRMLRMLFIVPQIYNQNMVLIFFYLCAAEISPILIISKLLTNLV